LPDGVWPIPASEQESGETASEPSKQRVAVSDTLLAARLDRRDPTAGLPIGGRHDGIDVFSAPSSLADSITLTMTSGHRAPP
jgi:hypothetical protein